MKEAMERGLAACDEEVEKDSKLDIHHYHSPARHFLLGATNNVILNILLLLYKEGLVVAGLLILCSSLSSPSLGRCPYRT